MQIQPIVIGTAGHSDHGKSSLVQTLTGTDPDPDPDRFALQRARVLSLAQSA